MLGFYNRFNFIVYLFFFELFIYFRKEKYVVWKNYF